MTSYSRMNSKNSCWFARHWLPVAVITRNWYWRGSVWHDGNWEAFVLTRVARTISCRHTKCCCDMENGCLLHLRPPPYRRNSNDTQFERGNKNCDRESWTGVRGYAGPPVLPRHVLPSDVIIVLRQNFFVSWEMRAVSKEPGLLTQYSA